jgi:hypothetical protein
LDPVVSTGRTAQAEGYSPGPVRLGLVRNTYTSSIRIVVGHGKKDQGSSTILGSVVHTNGWLLKLVLYVTATRPLKPSVSLHTRRPAVE